MLGAKYLGLQFILLSGLVLLSACAAQAPAVTEATSEFSITRSNPATMVDPALFGYTQIVTVNHGRWSTWRGRALPS